MRWISLLGWMMLCLAVAGLGGLWTDGQVSWYARLKRPAFAPPNWIFGPVWSLLYLAMSVAAWRVWELPASAARAWAISLFLVQLALNFAWTWFFFRRHAIGGALAEIVVLWASIAATMLAFSRLSAAATWIMAPYLAWVTFAALLNAGFWRLNREPKWKRN